MLRYALTVFVSAFLLFQVQPLIGRFILPWFGGGPSIWTGCMLFFQAALLAGYLYAHLLCARLSLRAQAWTHLFIVGCSVLLLPIAPDEAWKPTEDQAPLSRILLLLLATVGGPYFVLASTGPLMQKWFSQTSPDRSPYRLYALSNIGSLLALLSYPFVFEPWLALHTQVLSWTAAYLAFAGFAGWCAVAVLKHSKNVVVPAQQAEFMKPVVQAAKPSILQVLLWLSLSACGSAILLATTNQLCIDVATVPFLWILPLSIYLISFIICFDQPRWYDRRAFGLLLLVCVPLAARALSSGADLDLIKQVTIFSAALFACCMSCHGELVQSRPDPKYLTLFYLAISAGGVLGGLFVAIVATNLFTGYWEYPISLVACCLCTLLATCYQRVWIPKPSIAFWTWAGGAIATLITVIALIWLPHRKSLSELDEVGMFGGLGILILIGLVLIGITTEKRSNLWVWYGLAALPIAWAIGWGMGRIPQVMIPRIISLIAGVSLLAFSVSVATFWGLRHRSEVVQGVWIRLLILCYAGSLLGLASYQKIITDQQCFILLSIGLVAIVAEWALSRLRWTRGWSLGLWYWLPMGALIGLLGYNLKRVTDASMVEVVQQSRNFYGVLNVEYDQDTMPARYELTHGQIQHGCQFDDEYWKTQPTTYYGEVSGLGLAIQTARERKGESGSIRVGIVGLGTGTIAAYGEANDSFIFYEINPAVRDLSGRYFTYLQDTEATTQVKIGDARIVMERELKNCQRQQFDVLAIDAFSSDAIPVHLLTAECGELYRQHVAEGGILAIHISNRFLDLGPVVRGLADKLHWHSVRIENDDDNEKGVFSSTWVLLTSDAELASQLETSVQFSPWSVNAPKLLWTDDYSGLWRILSF